MFLNENVKIRWCNVGRYAATQRKGKKKAHYLYLVTLDVPILSIQRWRVPCDVQLRGRWGLDHHILRRGCRDWKGAECKSVFKHAPFVPQRDKKGKQTNTHTRLSDKHFLWRAAGTLPHSVVHTQTDLVAFVFAQICEERRQRCNRTVEIKKRRGKKKKGKKKKWLRRDHTVTAAPVARQHHRFEHQKKKDEGLELWGELMKRRGCCGDTGKICRWLKWNKKTLKTKKKKKTKRRGSLERLKSSTHHKNSSAASQRKRLSGRMVRRTLALNYHTNGVMCGSTIRQMAFKQMESDGKGMHDSERRLTIQFVLGEWGFT